MIPNIYFIILLGIFTAYLTFLTTKGGLTDNRFSNLWSRLTKRGKTVFWILLIFAVLLTLQELNNQAKSDERDRVSKSESAKRDSLITAGVKAGVDSNRKKLFSDIAEAFKKQELRLDTVKKDVERIRDSTRGITNNYSQPDPVLLIGGSGVFLTDTSNNIKHYAIEFTSVDAGSTNFNIKCYQLTDFIDGSSDVSRNFFFPKKMRLPKNGKWTSGFGSKILKDAVHIYFYVTGQFTTLDGTKSYDVDDVYDFDVKKQHVSVLVGKEREKRLSVIKSIRENEFE